MRQKKTVLESAASRKLSAEAARQRQAEVVRGQRVEEAAAIESARQHESAQVARLLERKQSESDAARERTEAQMATRVELKRRSSLDAAELQRKKAALKANDEKARLVARQAKRAFLTEVGERKVAADTARAAREEARGAAALETKQRIRDGESKAAHKAKLDRMSKEQLAEKAADRSGLIEARRLVARQDSLREQHRIRQSIEGV